mgnify:CR=1 FL=1
MSPNYFNALRSDDVRDFLKEEDSFKAYGFNLLESDAIQRLEQAREFLSESESESNKRMDEEAKEGEYSAHYPGSIRQS